MSNGITVEHHVPHVYTQNSLGESLVKHLPYTARSLIIRTKLQLTI